MRSVMRHTSFIVLLLSSFLVLIVSCSKKATSFDESDELVRFNAYQQVHFPEARKLSDHVFVQTLKSNIGGESIKSGAWLYFDFWAVNLDGVYLGTNVAERAKLYNQYSAVSYYASSYKEVSADQLGIEIYEAICGAHVGDQLVLGLTASKAKELGLWTNPDHVSALFYIEPCRVVSDPEKYEEGLIANYLSKNSGFEKHDSVYRKVVEVGTGNLIEKKSTIWVQYEVYSLNGYLFDTNIAEVAQQYGIYSSSSSSKYNLLSYKASEDSKLIRGFSGLAVGLKTGTRFRAVIPSALAYKERGNRIIRPYEPLVVEMSIVRSSK